MRLLVFKFYKTVKFLILILTNMHFRNLAPKLLNRSE